MIDGLKFAYFYVFPLLLSFTFLSFISPSLSLTHTLSHCFIKDWRLTKIRRMLRKLREMIPNPASEMGGCQGNILEIKLLDIWTIYVITQSPHRQLWALLGLGCLKSTWKRLVYFELLLTYSPLEDNAGKAPPQPTRVARRCPWSRPSRGTGAFRKGTLTLHGSEHSAARWLYVSYLTFPCPTFFFKAYFSITVDTQYLLVSGGQCSVC